MAVSFNEVDSMGCREVLGGGGGEVPRMSPRESWMDGGWDMAAPTETEAGKRAKNFRANEFSFEHLSLWPRSIQARVFSM